MNLLTWFVLSTLAAFRLSELVVIDDGPFDMFSNLRGWVNRPPLDEHPVRRNLAGILSCVHCAGLWFSFALGIVFYFSTSSPIVDSVLFVLAVAGGQSILINKLGRNSQ